MAGNRGKRQWNLNDPNERFHITAELANTLQGRIYASTDRSNGQFTVIKETWKQLVKSGKSRDGCPVPEDFFAEKRILTQLSNDPRSHPNFVHIICEWEEDLTYNYAMEGCKDGDLFDFVKNKHLSHIKKYRAKMFESNKKYFSKNPLPNNTDDKWIRDVRHMFRQLVDCLDWMHEKGICHLDMSLENTMVYDGQACFIKIIDFGLARQCNVEKNEWKHNRRVGKRGYMAPEVYAKQVYDCRAADIWSLGVMLYMMLIGAPPYELPVQTCVPFRYLVSKKLKEMLTHWRRLHYVTSDIIDLLVRIFRTERHRIKMHDIKKHPFVGLHTPLYQQPAVPAALTSDASNKSTTEFFEEKEFVTQGGIRPPQKQSGGSEANIVSGTQAAGGSAAGAAGTAGAAGAGAGGSGGGTATLSAENGSSNNSNASTGSNKNLNKPSQSYVSVATDSGFVGTGTNDTPPQLAVNSNSMTSGTSQQSQSSNYTNNLIGQSSNSTNLENYKFPKLNSPTQTKASTLTPTRTQSPTAGAGTNPAASNATTNTTNTTNATTNATNRTETGTARNEGSDGRNEKEHERDKKNSKKTSENKNNKNKKETPGRQEESNIKSTERRITNSSTGAANGGTTASASGTDVEASPDPKEAESSADGGVVTVMNDDKDSVGSNKQFVEHEDSKDGKDGVSPSDNRSPNSCLRCMIM